MKDAKQYAESVVQIDADNLDKECIRLPSDYLKWAHRLAEAQHDLDEHKAELDVVEADTAKSVRKNPGKFGIEKITEAAIKDAVTSCAAHKITLQSVQQARYHLDLTQAVVKALEHKKRALTLLVELHGMGYFAEPRVSKEGKAAVESMTRKRVRRHIDDREEA